MGIKKRKKLRRMWRELRDEWGKGRKEGEKRCT